MNKAKILDRLSIALLVIMLGLAIYFYQVLPDTVITHWNAKGEPDDVSSKNFFVIFMPLLTLGIYLLFRYLPKIDPKKRNYPDFDFSYQGVKLLIIAFLVAMFIISSLVNLNYNINISILVSWMVAVLFIALGFLIKNVKQNWFMGIRTPWTLSSETVWKKTHIFAQKVFILAGLIFIFLPFFPVDYMIWLIVVIVFLVALSTFVYSYWLYKNLPSDK